MSELRKQTVNIQDLDLLEKVAKELGYKVTRNVRPSSYLDPCELSVYGDYTSIGFNMVDGQAVMSYDNMQTASAMQLKMKLETAYKIAIIRDRAELVGFNIYDQTETTEETIIRLRRY